MTEDLAARLLAAIENTERIARVSEGPRPFEEWVAQPYRAGVRGWIVDCKFGALVVDRVEESTAQHIAHNDPAAVLRRCAADRKIVQLHHGYHECSTFGPNGEVNWDSFVLGTESCTTLLALAEGYDITEEANHG